jgi:hypothetical protein
MTPLLFFCLNSRRKLKLPLVSYFLIVSLLSDFSVQAQQNYIRHCVIGGTVKQSGVPATGKVVVTKSIYDANKPGSPDYSISYFNSVTNAFGYFSFVAPRYTYNPPVLGLTMQQKGKVLVRG